MYTIGKYNGPRYTFGPRKTQKRDKKRLDEQGGWVVRGIVSTAVSEIREREGKKMKQEKMRRGWGVKGGLKNAKTVQA